MTEPSAGPPRSEGASSKTSRDPAESSGQRDQLNARIIQGAGVNVLGVIANVASPLVMLAAMRLFGPAIVGVYVVAARAARMTESALLSGYTEGILRFGAQLAYRDDETHQRRFYELVANAMVATLGLSLLAVAAVFVPRALELAIDDALVIRAIQWIFVGLPFAAFREVVIAMTRSMLLQRFNLILDNVVLPGSALILVIVGGWLVPTLDVLLAAIVLSRILTAFVAAFVFVRLFSVSKMFEALRGFRFHRGLSDFALPQNLNMVFSQFALGGDVLLLPAYGVAPGQVAFYTIGVQFLQDLRTIRRSFGALLAPVVARLHGEGRLAQIGEHVVAVGRWSLMLVIPAALAIVALAGDILRIYHPSFDGSTSFVAIRSLGSIAGASIGISGSVLLMMGHSRWTLLNSVVAAGVTFGLASILIPRFGLEGAAWTTTLAGITGALVCLLELYLLEGFALRWGGYGKPLLAGAIASAAIFGGHLVLPDTLLMRLVGLAAALLIYGGVLFALGVDPEDRAALSRALGRRRRTRPSPSA
jgi:O-antigen/teichoic acid export membrane protein